ncbi:ABC transporter ATP-binding protein [Sutcliffiella cohnii]
MKKVVSVEGVTKVFKGKKAVDDVSFIINSGESVAILGPNGAGKSTTILMMLGLLQPTTGNVQLFNDTPSNRKVREKIGAMLQEVSIIDALKVKEVIQLFRSYYPHPLSFEELVSLTGLKEGDLKKRADKLSGGQKRRLSFALALAGNPDLLFLDEPTVGMDIHSRSSFWKTIQALKEKGKTIIFCTHYLQEADDMADRIILFHKGNIIADGSTVDIKRKVSKQTVSFLGNHHYVAVLKSQPFVSNVHIQDERIVVTTDNTDQILSYLFDKKLNVKDIRVEQGRLDDVFEQLTLTEVDVVETINGAM